MAVDNKGLWLKFLNEIATKVGGGAPDLGVQTVFPFGLWDWGGKNYPINSIPYAQQIALDRVPLAPIGNYLPSPAKLSDNYLQFLSQLNLQDGSDPKLDELYQAYQDALAAEQSALNQAQTAWKNDKVKPADETFDAWLAKSAVWKGKVEQATADTVAARTNYNDYRTQKFADIQRAISKFNDNQLYITNPAGQPVQVAPWFTDQQPYKYVLEITGNNFGGDATKGNAFSFSFGEKTADYDYKRIWGEAEASFSNWFVSVYLGGKFENVNASQFKSNWSIEVTFQSFDAMGIGIPDWYDSGVVQGRRNGPYRTGFSGYKNPLKPNDVWFFGPGGILARMMTQMWVGYRPTVVIDAGTEAHSFMKQKIEAGGSLQIGPFRFSGKGGSEEYSSFDFTDSSKVTVTNKSDWPYIICNTALPTVVSAQLDEMMRATMRAAAAPARPALAAPALPGPAPRGKFDVSISGPDTVAELDVALKWRLRSGQ